MTWGRTGLRGASLGSGGSLLLGDRLPRGAEHPTARWVLLEPGSAAGLLPTPGRAYVPSSRGVGRARAWHTAWALRPASRPPCPPEGVSLEIWALPPSEGTLVARAAAALTRVSAQRHVPGVSGTTAWTHMG